MLNGIRVFRACTAALALLIVGHGLPAGAQPQPTIRDPAARLRGVTIRTPIALPAHTVLGTGVTAAEWNPLPNNLFVAGTANAIHSVIANSEPVALPSRPVSWSTEGSRVLLDGGNNTALVYHAKSRTSTVSLSTGRVMRISQASWSPDDTRIATVGSDGPLRVWRVSTGTQLFTIGFNIPGSPNDPNQSLVTDVARDPVWTRDGTRLLVLHSVSNTSPQTFSSVAELRDGQTGSLVRAFNAVAGESAEPTMVAQLTRDGTRILLAGSNVDVRNAATGARIVKMEVNSTINSAEWNRTGSQIVLATHDGKFQIRDGATGAIIRSLDHVAPEIGGSTSSLQTARFSPVGAKVLTARGRTVRIWDATTGALLQTFEHGSTVAVAQWRPSGDGILTIETTGRRAHLWSVS